MLMTGGWFMTLFYPTLTVINSDTTHMLIDGWLPPIEMWQNCSNTIRMFNDCFTHITSILGSWTSIEIQFFAD